MIRPAIRMLALTVLGCSAWSQTVPVKAGVSADSGRCSLVITNNYSSALTAFELLAVADEGCTVDCRARSHYDGHIPGFSDPPQPIWEIAPGKTKALPYRNFPTPASVQVVAALFADGSSSGDPRVISELTGRRRIFFSEWQEMAAKLRSPEAQQMQIPELMALVKSRHEQYDKTHNGLERAAASSVYFYTAVSLQESQESGKTAEDAIAAVMRTADHFIANLKHDVAPGPHAPSPPN